MPRLADEDLRKRKQRLLMLLQRHPDGLSEREIAVHFDMERRTANNYLRDLESRSEVYKDGTLWIAAVTKPLRLRPLDVEAEEAMALYLAARLLVKQSDRRNESIETALEKLSHVLSSDTGIGDDLVRAVQELMQRPVHETHQSVFRTIMRAYLYRRVIEIVYTPYNGKPFRTTFAPYLLEPSALGFAIYVIGYSTIANNLRTYKIGRIEQATLTRESYSVPSDFDGLALLRTAWSIYYGESTTAVTLRFAPDVARRVAETNWHPSQQLQKDGQHLLMQVDVADFTDLIPWIRGWGAACEVLEPAELRDRMIGEARQLAEVYGCIHSDADQHSRFNDIFGD